MFPYIIPTMRLGTLPLRTLDRMAIGLSGICLVHCVATTVLVATLASAGGFLGNEHLHEFGLGLAMILGSYSLGRGALEHGYMMPSAVGGLGLGVMGGALTMPHDGNEIVATMIGVAILALGHRLNQIAGD